MQNLHWQMIEDSRMVITSYMDSFENSTSSLLFLLWGSQCFSLTLRAAICVITLGFDVVFDTVWLPYCPSPSDS